MGLNQLPTKFQGLFEDDRRTAKHCCKFETWRKSVYNDFRRVQVAKKMIIIMT
jgi:hypothetical protein